MLVHVNVNLDEVASLGKSFNWQKPNCCPRCKNNLWGHGFTGRYFDGYDGVIFLKRYRCPCCKLITILKPLNFYRKYQTSISKIAKTLKYRLVNFTWPPWTTRQRAGHWLRKFNEKVKMDFLLKEEVLGIVGLLEWMLVKEIPLFI